MLEISGAADCPTPEEVSNALSAIVVVAEGRTFDERARVERDGPSLRVVLESKAGAVIATRALHAEGTCEDLAAAAAVVLASWLGDAYPELVSGVPGTAEAAAQSDPQPRASAVPVPAEPAAPAAARRPAAPSASTHRVAPSAALGASISGPSAAPLAVFGASWIAPDPSLGVWAGLSLSGTREQPLGNGVVRWSRWPAMAGPLLRLASGRMRADVSAGGAVAWLRIEGERFDTNAGTEDATYGAYASAKFSGGPRALEPFFGVHALLWAKGATAYLEAPTPQELELPGFEVWFVGGIAIEP